MKRSLHTQLRAVGSMLDLDCGDNSCLFAEHKGGMRTNGGCRCDLAAAVGRATILANALNRLEPLLRSNRIAHVSLSFELRHTHESDDGTEPVFVATANDAQEDGGDWRDYFGADLEDALVTLIGEEEKRG